MSYYLLNSNNLKQENENEEDEEEVESENEVEMIWMDAVDSNEVDPLAIVKQEVIETPRSSVTKSLVPVLNNSFNPIRAIKTEYLTQPTFQYENDYNSLNLKTEPENVHYVSSPSISPSIFEISSSDDEEPVVKKPSMSQGVNIVDLVPDLDQYINISVDIKTHNKSACSNQSYSSVKQEKIYSEQIQIQECIARKVHVEEYKPVQIQVQGSTPLKIKVEESLPHQLQQSTPVQIQVQASAPLQIQVEKSLPLQVQKLQIPDREYEAEKLPVRECNVLLHKLPDVLVQQFDLPRTKDADELSEPVNIEYNIKNECSSLSPSPSIYDENSFSDDYEDDVVQDEQLNLQENKPISIQETTSSEINNSANGVLQNEQNKKPFFMNCDVCCRTFARLYHYQKHMQSMVHKMMSSAQLKLNRNEDNSQTHVDQTKAHELQDDKYDPQSSNLESAHPRMISFEESSSNRVKEENQSIGSIHKELIKYNEVEIEGKTLFICNYCEFTCKMCKYMSMHWKGKKHKELLEKHVFNSENSKDEVKNKNLYSAPEIENIEHSKLRLNSAGSFNKLKPIERSKLRLNSLESFNKLKPTEHSKLRLNSVESFNKLKPIEHSKLMLNSVESNNLKPIEDSKLRLNSLDSFDKLKPTEHSKLRLNSVESFNKLKPIEHSKLMLNSVESNNLKPIEDSKLRSNSVEIPFSCVLCGYKTLVHTNFKRHTLKHHPQESCYACSICKVNFKDINQFKAHRITHLKVKSFSCEFCTYVCEFASNLKKHQLNHHPDTKLYTCPYCKSNFEDIIKLKIHKLIHLKEHWYGCNNCDYKSKNKKNIQQHRTTHLNKQEFSCNLCDFTTKFNHSLKRHSLSHHTSKISYTCSICKKVFDSEVKFENHKSVHSKKRRFRCNLCDFTTSFNHSLKRHNFSHHTNKRSYVCPTCKTSVRGYINFREHQALHTKKECDIVPNKSTILNEDLENKSKSQLSINLLVCDVCNARFKTRHELKIHKTTHLEGRVFCCNNCEYRTKYIANLDRHMLTVHLLQKLPKKIPFTCRVCKANFDNYNLFKIHETTHLKGPLYYCEHCEYRSRQLTNLQRHQRNLHSKKKSFTCRNCRQFFKDYNKYKCHKCRNHDGEVKIEVKDSSKRVFTCNICNASFENKVKHMIHKTTHLEGKVFRCYFCEYRCRVRHNLIPHIRIHHPEIKSFSCNLCTLKFYNVQIFMKHELRHMEYGSKIDIFDCNFCDYKSRFKGNLKKHIIRNHSEMQPFTCTLCNLSFNNVSYFLQHKLIHEKVKTSKLEDDKVKPNSVAYPYITSSLSDNNIQDKTIVCEKQKCDKCEFTTKNENFLRVHKNKFHTGKFEDVSIKIYKCDICIYSTTVMYHLKRHITQVHLGVKPFTCHICDKSFYKKFNLELHLTQHQNSESEVVQEKVNKQNKITDHFTYEKAAEEYKYTPVSEALAPVVNIKEETEFVKKSFICNFCTAVFQTDRSLQDHVIYHNTYNSKKKENRGKNSKSGQSEIGDEDKSKNENKFDCIHCSESCKDKKSFDKHTLIHFGNKPYGCSRCDFRTCYRPTLKKHEQTHEKNNESEVKTEKIVVSQESFECCVCKGILKSQSLLIKHMKKHFPDVTAELEDDNMNENNSTGVKNDNTVNQSINKDPQVRVKNTKIPKCNLCFRRFFNQKELKRHMTSSHVDHKNFSCDQCSFKATTISNLKRHKERYHSEKVVGDNVKPHNCKICKSAFNSIRGLKVHMKFHNPVLNGSKTIMSELPDSENLYSCNICLRNYSNKYQLKRHQRLHTDAQYNCNSCNFTTKDPYYLKSHQKKKCKLNQSLVNKEENKTSILVKDKSEGTYRCHTCLTNYSSEHALTEHKRIHNGEKQFACDQCTFASDYKGNLKKHKMNRHPISTFKLTSALNFNKNKTSVLKTVSEQKSEDGKNESSGYPCDICQRYYSSRQHLARHKLIHFNFKPYTCDKCNHRTNDRSNFMRHMYMKHNINKFELTPKLENIEENKHLEAEGSYEVESGVRKGRNQVSSYGCNICHRIFSRKHHLTRHINIHKNIKPYACDKCNYRANDNTNLKRHKCKNNLDNIKIVPKLENKDLEGNEVKSRDRKNKRVGYYCDVCHRYYSSKNSLSRHKLLHPGLRQFACDKCKFRSNGRNHLRKHELRCHPIKLTSLPTSESVDENKDSEVVPGEQKLSKKSKRIHKFYCTICSHNYSTKASFNRHMRRHTGENPYSCDQCSFKTYDSSILKRHKSHHPDEENTLISQPEKKYPIRSIVNNVSVVSSELLVKSGGIKLVMENKSLPNCTIDIENIDISSSKLNEQNIYIPNAKRETENMTISSSKGDTENMNICMTSSNSDVENLAVFSSKLDEQVPHVKREIESMVISGSNQYKENMNISGSNGDMKNMNNSMTNSNYDVENLDISSSKLNEQNTYIPNVKRETENMTISSSKGDVENMIISMTSSNSDVENVAVSSKLVEENVCIPHVEREIDVSISSPNGDIENMNICMTSLNSDVENLAVFSSKLDEQVPHVKREIESMVISGSNQYKENMNISGSNGDMKNMNNSMTNSNYDVENLDISSSKLNEQNTYIPNAKRETENMSISSSKGDVENMIISMTNSDYDVENVAVLSSKLDEQNVCVPHVKRGIENMIISSSNRYKEHMNISGSNGDMENMNNSMTNSNSDVENVAVSSKLVEENVCIPHVEREIDVSISSPNGDIENMNICMTSSNSDVENLAVFSSKLDEQVPHVKREIESMVILGSNQYKENMNISGSNGDMKNMNNSMTNSNYDVENLDIFSSKLNEQNTYIPNAKRETENMTISSSKGDVENMIISMTSSNSDVENVAVSSKLVEENVCIPHVEREIDVSISSSNGDMENMNISMTSSNSDVENVAVSSKLVEENVRIPHVEREIDVSVSSSK